MTKVLYISLLFFLLGSGFAYSQASASASFTASVTIIEPIEVSTTSDMSFASIDARNAGTVVLSPEGTRSSQGDLRLAEEGQARAASFEISGENDYTYAITLPQDSYTLSNGEEEIVIRDFISSLGEAGSLAGGAESLKIGATLEVQSNQTPGAYTSQGGFNVTVNYN